jgi:excisionase family DNA binding protein
MATMEDDPLLTAKQVAVRLQVTPVTVQRWLRSGQLSGIILSDKMGWRVRESALRQFVEAAEHVQDEARAHSGREVDLEPGAGHGTG